MSDIADLGKLQELLLTGSAIILSVTLFFCLLRAMLGPRFTDRITAANIAGTKITVLTAVMSLIIGDEWMADICLICAVVSFLSVVVLSRSVPERVKE